MSIEFENKRVQELTNYQIMDILPEAELDEITKLTSIICETPISLITLLDNTRMWCLSKQGVDRTELPKDKSMCQYTIQQQDLLIVEDLLLDHRYKLDPIELGGPGYRFYAGMPLVTSNGYNIGALCIIDYKPRILSENQKFFIKSLAKQVMTNFDLRRNNSELLRLNGKIQSYKEKEEFYSNMSHELRTPLNAISGFADLLSKTLLDDNQKEQLRILRSSVDILISIINDILDYSKIDSGDLKLENNPFNLRTLIKTTYELLKIKAQEKNISLTVDVDKNIPSFINGDKLRLNQILINLLGNAIKFTNKGSVTLRMNVNRNSEKEIQLDFYVIDTGIGIPADKLKNIFNRYNQIEGMTRVFGGSGLGLNIAKNLVELQGGKIEVRSEFGKYSEFYFSLPYGRCNPEEISDFIKKETFKEIIPKPDYKDIKILLAEDNLVNVILIKKVFEGTGAHLDVSQNGKVCVERLKLKKYDLILMDMFMPEMDGCEATQYIRDTMMLKIPIIALSANISELNRKKCLDAGMNEYVSKPFKVEELFGVINKFLNKQDETKKENKSFRKDLKIVNYKIKNIEYGFNENNSLFCRPFTFSKRHSIKIKLKKPIYLARKKLELFPNKNIPNSSKDLKGNYLKGFYSNITTPSESNLKENLETINLMSLKDISGNDEEFEKEMIDAFLQEVPEYMKDLESEILKENYDAIKKAAHKLKSPMSIFGLNILKSKFEKIEEFSEKSQIVPIIKLIEFCKNNLSSIMVQLKNL